MNRKNALWKRVFAQYALLLMMAFSLVFATLLFSISKTINQERTSILEQELKNCSYQLDRQISEVMSLQTQLLNSPLCRQSIRAAGLPGGLAPGEEKNLQEFLKKTEDSSWLISSVYLFDRDLELIGGSAQFLPEGVDGRDLIRCLQQFRLEKAFRAIVPSNGHLMLLGSLYVDDSYRYEAYFAVKLNQNRLFYGFARDSLESFDQIFLVDGEKIVMASDPQLPVTAAALTAGDSLRVEGRDYTLFHHTSSSYSGWKLCAMLDRARFRDVLVQQTTAVAVILVISLGATMVLSVVLAKRITHPLEELTQSFHRLEQGEYPPSLEVRSNDEVGQLIHGYNHVVKSLRKLNSNIIAEQEEKRKFELAAMKTRLDLLQSQIQPHFIHNTLNTLKCMAVEAGNLELAEIITSFNSLLRMSISTESDFFPVDSEIACTKHYMRIQQARYADRNLQCTFAVEEGARNALLPRLVLQPLVENALYHGILPCEDRPGEIRVQITRVGEQLCVSVTDNGMGITGEKLAQIQRGESVSPSGYNHIGLKNVKERLQLMYRQECDFKILSEEGCGTTIFFSVPYRR